MKLPAIQSLIGIRETQLFRILSGITQTLAIRFHGKAGQDEQVVLHKDLYPLVQRESKGITGEVGFISGVRLVDGVLEMKRAAVSIEKGRIINVQESEWI